MEPIPVTASMSWNAKPAQSYRGQHFVLFLLKALRDLNSAMRGTATPPLLLLVRVYLHGGTLAVPPQD